MKRDKLEQLGIRYVLNMAQASLYEEIRDELEPFSIKIIGAADHREQDVSVYFSEIADFIKRGREAGGVVVHCAAGISRATTGCLCYMMLEEHMKLDAALTKIYYVRSIIHPNEGFWRQLRDLEAVLLAKGVALRDLQPGELSKLELDTSDGREMPWQRAVVMMIQQLDKEAAAKAKFHSVHLTGHVFTGEGAAEEAAKSLLTGQPLPGITFEHASSEDATTVGIRVSLAASRLETAIEDVQAAVRLVLGEETVKSVEVEHCGPGV